MTSRLADGTAMMPLPLTEPLGIVDVTAWWKGRDAVVDVLHEHGIALAIVDRHARARSQLHRRRVGDRSRHGFEDELITLTRLKPDCAILLLAPATTKVPITIARPRAVKM
jgi:hypothetical protein